MPSSVLSATSEATTSCLEVCSSFKLLVLCLHGICNWIYFIAGDARQVKLDYLASGPCSKDERDDFNMQT